MAREKSKERLQKTQLERYIGTRTWNTLNGILTKFNAVSYTISLFHKLYYFYLICICQVTPTTVSIRFLHRPYRSCAHDKRHSLGTYPNNSVIPNLRILLWHLKEWEQINSSGRLSNESSPLRFKESQLS